VLEYLMRIRARDVATLIHRYAWIITRSWDQHVDVVITRLRKKIDHAKEPS